MSDLISGERADLAARIDTELRERIEEAVEFLCLDTLVERRRALGAWRSTTAEEPAEQAPALAA